MYRLFAYGLQQSAPQLTRTVVSFHALRPFVSQSHFFVLLGVALKEAAPGLLPRLRGVDRLETRLILLENAIGERSNAISTILSSRQHSITVARRFLLPQVLMSAYFRSDSGRYVNFADLGTGLGILPRQLNSKDMYDRFSNGLVWPGGVPAFVPIPLASRFGVDRGPMPDLDWVRSCYGESDYYDALYQELTVALHAPDVVTARVEYEEFDLLDSDSLVSFIKRHDINAANLCYVLYELEPRSREDIVATVLDGLSPPGLLMVTEPREELSQQGCTVTVYDKSSSTPKRLCAVSDGHFRGRIIPLDDYDEFVDRFPIRFESQ